jgi:hypothetical protein
LKENVIIGGLIPAGTGFTDDFIDMSQLPVREAPEEGGFSDIASA